MSRAGYRLPYFRLFVFAAGLVLTGGPAVCLAAASGSSSSPASATSSSSEEYVLQPLDQIKIEVFQEPDLTRELKLSQEGSVTLPLIGTINLKGKNILQAETLIRVLYDRDFLVNPQINLSVLEYAKRSVDVLGAVGEAGTIDIPPEQPLNLLGAVARAGGFTRLADRRKVKLSRNEDGKTVTYEINADAIIESRSDSEDAWLLKAGDVIFVPERLL